MLPCSGQWRILPKWDGQYNIGATFGLPTDSLLLGYSWCPEVSHECTLLISRPKVKQKNQGYESHRFSTFWVNTSFSSQVPMCYLGYLIESKREASLNQSHESDGFSTFRVSSSALGSHQCTLAILRPTVKPLYSNQRNESMTDSLQFPGPSISLLLLFWNKITSHVWELLLPGLISCISAELDFFFETKIEAM